MKFLCLFATVFFVFLTVRPSQEIDGLECAVCEMVLQELDRFSEKSVEFVERYLREEFCQMFRVKPSWFHECQSFMDRYSKEIIRFFVERMDPGKICEAVKLCNVCLLYGNGNLTKSEVSNRRGGLVVMSFANYLLRGRNGIGVSEPLIDLDKDGFGTFSLPGVAGSSMYRPKDCNDLSKEERPLIVSSDSKKDMNCNGVKGGYEEEYCRSFGEDGVDDKNFLVFGDSVSTGFSIMERWIDLSHLGEFLERVLFTGMGWPEHAITTGWCPLREGVNGSVYSQILERNKCAHRQYMSYGKAGAVMRDLEGQIQQYVDFVGDSKDRMKSSYVYLGYVGNDVCQDTPEQMTHPMDYKKQLLAGLALLDKAVQPHSKVMMIGLSNGAQYNLMWNVTHPVSSASKRINFADFYDWLTCIGVNPCSTWLNTNMDWRTTATKRALELDEVMKDVSDHYTWDNFETQYVDIDDIIKYGIKWMDDIGMPESKFFNQVDGFHPSIEYGHPLAGRAIAELFPELWGPKNPHNEDIEKMFGDQGGF